MTKFTTIKAILILTSLANAFPALMLLSIIIGFVSSFALRTLTLPFVASRALCSSRFVLSHESLLNRLFSKKSIFFKFNITSNIIKYFDVVVVGKVDMHVFLIIQKRTDHSLDLLLINHFMPSNPQLIDHVRHGRKMLPHYVILVLFVTIKFEGQLTESSSRGSSILNLQRVPNWLG